MSRSNKKHPFWKEGKSWRWEKKWMNRYNRNLAKQAIRNGEIPNPSCWKICSMDFDYEKCYIDKNLAQEFPKLLMK